MGYLLSVKEPLPALYFSVAVYVHGYPHMTLATFRFHTLVRRGPYAFVISKEGIQDAFQDIVTIASMRSDKLDSDVYPNSLSPLWARTGK